MARFLAARRTCNAVRLPTDRVFSGHLVECPATRREHNAERDAVRSRGEHVSSGVGGDATLILSVPLMSDAIIVDQYQNVYLVKEYIERARILQYRPMSIAP